MTEFSQNKDSVGATSYCEQLQETEPITVHEKTKNKSKNILIIDDNESITIMMMQYLTLQGHKVTVSNNGRNGLTLILGQKFDAILLDLSMPEFSGSDVLDYLGLINRIKEQNIILFTAANLTKEQLEQLYRKGVHACLKKPVGLIELDKVLE